MADVFSKKKRSEIMSKIRSKGTKIEIIFEHKLGENKVDFVMHPRMDGNPDFGILGCCIAVFVDGEFWHGRLWKKYGQTPRTDYWKKKILANMKRDQRTNRRLRKEGWSVIRFWERDVLKKPDLCIRRLEKKIQERRQD